MSAIGRPYISRAGERTARADGAALREARHREMMERDRTRQAIYRRSELAGNVQVQEQRLAAIQRDSDYIAAEIAEAEETMLETGRRPANLTTLRAAAADFPAMLTAAKERLDAARAALAAVGPEPVTALAAEPEPVAKPRGRR